jgi:hypothetical protein
MKTTPTELRLGKLKADPKLSPKNLSPLSSPLLKLPLDLKYLKNIRYLLFKDFLDVILSAALKAQAKQ